jgi:hypothetical protein
MSDSTKRRRNNESLNGSDVNGLHQSAEIVKNMRKKANRSDLDLTKIMQIYSDGKKIRGTKLGDSDPIKRVNKLGNSDPIKRKKKSNRTNTNNTSKSKSSKGEEPPEETYENLPSEVKNKFKKIGLTKEKIIENLNIIFAIAKFSMKDCFPELKKMVKIPVRTEIALKMGRRATKKIITPTVPIKKLYKYCELSGKGGFGAVIIAKSYEKKKESSYQKTLS